MKILFVCRGNVGRSQMAEVISNDLTQGKHHVFSAGTRVFDKEGVSRDGEKLYQIESAGRVIESLKEIGIDASNNQRHQITKEMVDIADKIVVMAERETIPDFLISSDKVVFWEIEDPKGKDQETTNRIRDEITQKVKSFILELGKSA